MKKSGGVAALIGVLVLVCGVVAWEWYAHVGERRAPQPVREITAATPVPTAAPSGSPGPVVYVPQTQPASSTAPSAAPANQTGASAAPQNSPAPYTTGSAQVTQPPMVAATLAPHVVVVKPILEAPNAPPRILAMSLSTPVARSGQVVSGTVETSSNVASVEARIAGYSSAMHKVGVGRFAMTYRVPYLPFFLHRTYTIEVIARNTRGDAVRSAVPITIR